MELLHIKIEDMESGGNLACDLILVLYLTIKEDLWSMAGLSWKTLLLWENLQTGILLLKQC